MARNWKTEKILMSQPVLYLNGKLWGKLKIKLRNSKVRKQICWSNHQSEWRIKKLNYGFLCMRKRKRRTDRMMMRRNNDMTRTGAVLQRLSAGENCHPYLNNADSLSWQSVVSLKFLIIRGKEPNENIQQALWQLWQLLQYWEKLHFVGFFLWITGCSQSKQYYLLMFVCWALKITTCVLLFHEVVVLLRGSLWYDFSIFFLFWYGSLQLVARICQHVMCT